VNQTPKKLHGYEHIYRVGFFKIKKLKNKKKEIEKQTSFFGILKTKKMEK